MGSTVTAIPAAGVTGVLPSAVTGGSGLTALGTVTSGTYNSTIGASATFPAGHIIQVAGSDNFHVQDFDDEIDVVIEASLTNVKASSYVSIFTSCTININNSAQEGFETTIFRKATSMGVAGTQVSGATKVNATGGSQGSATFTYKDISANMYVQTPFWCIDESPETGTNFYVLAGTAFIQAQPPGLVHDGNATIILMEIAQ